jgi:phosphopantothenate-cysteine ligase
VGGPSESDTPPVDLHGMLFPPVPAVAAPTTRTAPTPQDGIVPTSSEQIQIPPPHLVPMLSLLRSYKLVKNLGLLHSIAYTTVDEYLFFLRGVSEVMGKAKDVEGKALGRRGMYYLAAAVSDFFIPRQRMVSTPFIRRRIWKLMRMRQSEHKIQSGKGSLIIEMDQVPKVLKAMVDEWANDGYIVSFKVRPLLRPLVQFLTLLVL